MSINLTRDDHKNLEVLLGQILDWYAASEVTRGRAVGVLAHIIEATAIDDAQQVSSWINDPEALQRWKAGR